LAVGGPYGNPNNGTQFPANLQVDYIRAYATTAAPPVISQVSPAATADQLTLTGTAEGDSTVNIYEDRVLIGTAAASGTGAWSFTVGVPANGSHGFTATDSNAAHNTSTSSSALTVTVSVIQTDGSTSLIEVANQYFYLRASGGSSPALKYNGAAVTMGEFGSWKPIGAVQTASGYDVAWKNAGTGQYTVWTTETNGNYVGNLTGGAVSGTSYALESIESTFHQDLNGDGVIGPTATVIQTDGSTSLAEVGHLHFYLDGSSGIGPALRYNGTNFTVGEFGSWTPIGAVQTASGYDLAWKNTGSSQYTVWTTDSNGNYTGNLIGAVSATSTSLELLEPVFNQDLNGDGAIDLFAAPGTTLQISNALSGTSGSATIGTGATLELAAADSASITFASSTGSLRLDHSSTFTGEIFNFTGNGSLSGSDQLDLRDVHYSSVQDRYANGVLTVSDGSGDTAKLSFNGSYILANFKFASDGGGGTIVYDPPAPPINQNNNQAAGASSLAESFFGSNIALFANYIASAFVTAGHAGVTVTEALKSDQSLLCNPKHP
jgi:hypothetical protein